MTRHELILLAVNNNKEAADFYLNIFDALHFWDDLIDRDKVLVDSEINGIMLSLLLKIPGSSFFRKNEALLMPILVNSIKNWQIANQLERNPKDENDLIIAFILRSSYIDLLTCCLHLFFSPEKQIEIGCEIRRFTSSEGFDGYLKNLDAEKQARLEN
jgi:hypothetical protein